MKKLKKLTVAFILGVSFSIQALAAGPTATSSNITHNYETTTKYSSTVVNIRQLPSTDSDIISQFNTGDEIEVIKNYGEEIESWSAILYNDSLYWVCNKYIIDYRIKYTEDDLYIMAHLLAGECHTYPDQEQMYVGSVVLNRIKSSRYPDTLKGVVFQKGQYACTWDGNYYRTPTESNWINAKQLLENGSILPDHVIYQSGGKQGKGVYLKTKYHYYCY